MTETSLPRFPRLIDRVIGRLHPTLPLDIALERFVTSLAERHPRCSRGSATMPAAAS